MSKSYKAVIPQSFQRKVSKEMQTRSMHTTQAELIHISRFHVRILTDVSVLQSVHTSRYHELMIFTYLVIRPYFGHDHVCKSAKLRTR